jgi:hypothetical protein
MQAFPQNVVEKNLSHLNVGFFMTDIYVLKYCKSHINSGFSDISNGRVGEKNRGREQAFFGAKDF